MNERKNKNRGYRALRVWQHAVDLYAETCDVCRAWPFEQKKLAAQLMASADSVHRNIAEGYCRRSLREYLLFLNYALGSLGETGSAVVAYHRSGQLGEEQADALDQRIYQVENELLALQSAMQGKSTDSQQVHEPQAGYASLKTDLDILSEALDQSGFPTQDMSERKP